MERGGGFPDPRGKGHLKYKDRKEGEKYPSISNLLPVSPIGQTQLSISDTDFLPHSVGEEKWEERS